MCVCVCTCGYFVVFDVLMQWSFDLWCFYVLLMFFMFWYLCLYMFFKFFFFFCLFVCLFYLYVFIAMFLCFYVFIFYFILFYFILFYFFCVWNCGGGLLNIIVDGWSLFCRSSSRSKYIWWLCEIWKVCFESSRRRRTGRGTTKAIWRLAWKTKIKTILASIEEPQIKRRNCLKSEKT